MKHTLFKDSIFIDHYECGELKRLVKEKLEEDKKNNQGQVLSKGTISIVGLPDDYK